MLRFALHDRLLPLFVGIQVAADLGGDAGKEEFDAAEEDAEVASGGGVVEFEVDFFADALFATAEEPAEETGPVGFVAVGPVDAECVEDVKL